MTPSYRPPTSPGKFLRPLDALLSVRVDADLKQSLARAAAADGRTISSLVKKLLSEFLELERVLAARKFRTKPARAENETPTEEKNHVQP